ncbi:MAG: AAA domain-containing protein [candidate division Zixibacteria bacterium]|nr:AAA domain-containing protein [candidate division Zixibacteria bacterium]
MIKDCPYCRKQVKIPDILESGWYVCPYGDCSNTFFFDRDASTLHKIEEPTQGIPGDEIVIICPNPDCRQKLRIPKATGTLQVTCPKCRTSFRYPTRGKEAQHDISGLLAEFDNALDDEIKAVKTRGGDWTLGLKDGEFIGEIARGRIYQFNVERKIPVVDETPAQIEIMGRNYRASIVRFLEFKLEVCITDFDGERIPSARLKIDATYVLKKLKDALSSLTRGSWSPSLALKVFNYIPPKCSVGKPVFILLDDDGNPPDPCQSKAIEICLGNEVSFIHGPPGTGKTRTLVNVVNDLANNGKRVLVSCHTNIACDNVIAQFLKYERQETVKSLLKNGEIVRIGTPVLQDQRIRELTIEAIHERLSKELRQEKEALTASMDSLSQRNKRSYEYKQIFLECQDLAEKIARCEQNIRASRHVIEQHILEEDQLNQIISQKKQLLSTAEKRNTIVNFFRGTRPQSIRLAITNLNNRKMEKTRTRLQEEKRFALLSNELAKLNTSFSERTGRLPKGISIEQIESLLKETESTLDETKIQIANVEDRISKLNEGVLNNTKIIVSTLAKTFTDPILMNMQFDVVAIDEASIAPLPMLFYVCSLAKEKVLIFGDPKQLAPIALADTPAAQKWLKKDIFQEAEAREKRVDDSRIETLDNQYRMHGDIFRIVKKHFYQDLYDRRPATDKNYHKYDGSLIPMPEHRVVIIDTSNANACMSTEKTGPKSSSRYNLYHIETLEKILHDLIGSNHVEEREIAIITPYRSQASFVREMLMESRFKGIESGTVHSFQGIEKEYVIFDFVEAIGGKRIGVLVNDRHEKYTGKSQEENEALRLLTVAFSRPREKLLIISHNKHMLSELPEDSVIKNIIVDLINRKAIVDGSKLVPYYIPVDEYPDSTLFSEEELLGREAVFNQRSFYPHLIKDLGNATKEVIFISGYMTTNRIERLMPHFTDLLSRGVNIKIFTKPPREQMSREQELEELHHRLKNMGIEIYQRYGTHEKTVAIDGHILYDGSLNVLSFSHSSLETMTRIDSKLRLQKKFSVIVKNHPEMDYLTKTGYVIPEQIVDLTPERSQNIRPKNRELPKTKQDAEEYYRSMLKKLRRVIADDKKIPFMAILHNRTIEAMLNNPPITVEQLLSLPEFRRNRTNIRGYENIVLKILKEYREVSGEDEVKRRKL